MSFGNFRNLGAENLFIRLSSTERSAGICDFDNKLNRIEVNYI